MKIALVTNGRSPIPAPNLGSIENIAWNYKIYLERLGHTVDIYNSVWVQDTLYELNSRNYDFIHLHFELFALDFNKHLKQPYCLTCHSGAFSRFVPGKFDYYPGFNYSFEDCLTAPGNLVLSDPIKDMFAENGYNKFLRVLRNPVETEKFRFAEKGNGKAICVGRIQARKRQAWLADTLKGIVNIDFVGPYEPANYPEFAENITCKYLGNWERSQVYDQLTNYSCLVLFSKSEADPLVVKEAMAAGLSIVVADSCNANLTDEEFITVLSSETQDGAVLSNAIQKAIDANGALRKKIRAYAFERFDYSVIVQEYLKIIEEFNSVPDIKK